MNNQIFKNLPFLGYEPPVHIVITERLKPKLEPVYDKDLQNKMTRSIVIKSARKNGLNSWGKNLLIKKL
jgi:hypothetical protein